MRIVPLSGQPPSLPPSNGASKWNLGQQPAAGHPGILEEQGATGHPGGHPCYGVPSRCIARGEIVTLGRNGGALGLLIWGPEISDPNAPQCNDRS